MKTAMRSLQFRLLAGFLAVTALTVAMLAIVATSATDRAFAAYVRQGQAQRLERLQADLADYYARTQSWANVQPLLDSGGGAGRMMGPGMGMGRGVGQAGAAMMGQQTVILSDGQGNVLAWSGAEPAGKRLSQRETAAALPVTVGGRVVGYVLGEGPGLTSFSGLEQEFVSSVNTGLLAASLLAAGLAVVISVLLARRLTAPLASMTQAAQAMAHGDLSARVKAGSGDEIGRLADAFNSMAAGLERAEELRRSLVADVAHELRTPLAVLRADLEAIQDGVYQPTAERLATLHEETDMLARLVTDLGELSLAEAGQLSMARRPTELLQVCQQTVSVMAGQAAARQVTLAMGAQNEGAISDVDPDRMGQVLRNLVGNALRYTPAGGSVTLECRAGAGENTISVRDTGSGIKAEDLPHVFDRFYRGEKSRARATGGAGLGLAIVKQIVEAHAGRVSAESVYGQGAAFTIHLPKA